MNGKDVDFASSGDRGSGYLSRPITTAGPGVVVIQEWWGLNSNVRSIADRFAGEGFVALAPDFYHGRVTGEPDEAAKLMMALDVDRAAQDVRGACRYLLDKGDVSGSRVGVVGFCMGGALAMYAATVAIEEIGAVVDFYGGHPKVTPDYARLQAPVLGLFADEDDFVTPEIARGIERQMRDLGKEIEIHIYPGTQHAFFNDDRPEVYAPEAAADAWRRTLAFFRQHLMV